MLLNCYGSNSPYTIERIELPCFRPHKLRVISLIGIVKEYASPGLYRITCDLIEREPGNQHRILGFVIVTHKQLYIEFQPTHSIWYKLRFTEINFADIEFQSVTSDESIIFEEFSFQLEVSEAYGGI